MIALVAAIGRNLPTVGAAGKAVVYQWETGRRKPSPVFWLRIERLQCQVENPRPNSNT
jgi:hypothetical protein